MQLALYRGSIADRVAVASWPFCCQLPAVVPHLCDSFFTRGGVAIAFGLLWKTAREMGQGGVADSHVVTCAQEFPSLTLKKDTYTHVNGTNAVLLLAEGTLPMYYAVRSPRSRARTGACASQGRSWPSNC